MKMKKSYDFGKFAVRSSRRVNDVVAHIKLEENDGKFVFTASCDVWNAKHTDLVMGGQCFDTVLKYCPELRDSAVFMEIVGLWRKHHLNDMHAGTEAQEAELEKWRGHAADYKADCQHLKEVGLYEDNGYRYGTSWLYRPIPWEDLNRINQLVR